MIISHKYKFIFIKTAKTAGTSIEIYLSKFCGENDIITPIFPPENGHKPQNYTGYFNILKTLYYLKGKNTRRIIKHFFKKIKFYNHISALEIKARISPEIWNNYFKFCVERNYLEKTISHYNMLNMRNNNKLSFEEYLSAGSLCYNFPKYCDTKGNVIVDKIIKYENLNEELTTVFKYLGIPFSGNLTVNAKKIRKKNTITLNNEQKNKLAKLFARENTILASYFQRENNQELLF